MGGVRTREVYALGWCRSFAPEPQGGFHTVNRRVVVHLSTWTEDGQRDIMSQADALGGFRRGRPTGRRAFGLEAPTPHVRPFVDLYLIDILDRESAVGVNLLMGLQVHVSTRKPS